MESEARKTVLVVDDEPAILVYLTTLLEDNGFAARVAPGAEEAAREIERQRPDLICMDIMMPRRSGIAFYCDIRLHPEWKDIPVVFVSGYTQAHNTLKPEDPGFFRRLVDDERVPEPEAFFEKPIPVKRFLRTISAILDGVSCGMKAGEQDIKP